MSHGYEIRFTHSAQVTAVRSSLSALEERARAEIAQLMHDGLEGIESLELHTFEMPDGQEYVCFPAQEDDNVLVVDTCIRRQIKITHGRLAGKTIEMPEPESE